MADGERGQTGEHRVRWGAVYVAVAAYTGLLIWALELFGDFFSR